MSYIVEQKIKGNIYLYEVESYWDKEKKQARQKRTYIGPKNPKRKVKVKESKEIIHKNYGDIFLLRVISERIGLTELLKEVFPERYMDILALAFFHITQRDAFYLYPYWYEDTYFPEAKKLNSSTIAKLLEYLGINQQKRSDFQEKWIKMLKAIEALYYDITSISSYSNKIYYVEWGYNRDKENLPQINLGIVYSTKHSLPIHYFQFPGSIVDVSTLKNCVKYLKIYGLKRFTFVLDRGFFSTSNISAMANSQEAIDFIQPLPFSLKKVKELIKKHKMKLKDVKNKFLFNNELLSHIKTTIDLGDKIFPVHIFFNEQAELEQKQLLIRKIIEIEEKIIKNKVFPSLKEASVFKEENISKTYRKYFKWNRNTKKLERNNKTINATISKLGYFVILTNREDLNKEDILHYYRSKDQIEKLFDVLKNQLNENRLKVHSQMTADGKLFINFISLIIESEIIRIMRKKKLFKKYTQKELLFELRKIKRTQIYDQVIISEISKKQKEIFKAFEINIDSIHSY